MPSNAMKISQLVQHLDSLRGVHGDLDVVLALPRAGEVIAVDGSNVGVAVSFPWGRVPTPVLAFGIWNDPQGESAAKAVPGKPYQYTETASEFTYERHAAPIGQELMVWTRGSGEQRGIRESKDAWFVFNEEGRKVQWAPQGILGWRVP